MKVDIKNNPSISSHAADIFFKGKSLKPFITFLVIPWL